MKEPILFYKQFQICKKEGFTGKGEKRPFKDYPELLPSPFHRVAKAIAETLKKDPDFGFDTISCLRFGGECSSAHTECRKMRNITI
jgi:hypothetical protein